MPTASLDIAEICGGSLLDVWEEGPLIFLRNRSGGAAPRRLPLRTARSLLYIPLCCEACFYKELGPLFHWLCYTYWEHDSPAPGGGLFTRGGVICKNFSARCARKLN